MMRKMACTTLIVVCRPTLSAPMPTRKPWKHPTVATMAAKTGALLIPTRNEERVPAWGARCRKSWKPTPSCPAAMAIPPATPIRPASTVSSGRARTSPTTRGATSSSTGSMPMVRRASTSSWTFMDPICAVKADPVRPATMIAAIIGASSRSTMRITRSTT